MWSDLPTEILLHVFGFIEPMFLVRTVTQVCMRFREVILDREYMRLNYYQLLYAWWPQVEDVPLLNHLKMKAATDWKELGSHLDQTFETWQEPTVKLFRGSVCPVDAVHILKTSTVCLVGSRERSVDFWDVQGEPEVKYSIPAAHRGWVTSLESFEQHSFLSGGFDSFTTMWQLTESSCQAVWSLDCQRGVMSVAARHDMIAVATFSPILILVDPRVPTQHHKFEVHSKALADVAITGNHIISVARDRALNVFDIRMMSTVMRRNRFAGTVKGGQPKCLSVQDNIVYIGDSFGYAHMLDAKINLKAFHSVPVAGSKITVTSIIPDMGTFYSGTSDGVLRVIAPSKNHFVLKEIRSDKTEITTMSHENHILAVGKTSGVVECYFT